MLGFIVATRPSGRLSQRGGRGRHPVPLRISLLPHPLPSLPGYPWPMDSIWRQKSFIRFWWARITGTIANQMLMLAVGWQMYDLTGSAWDLGLVGLYQFVPALALSLWAGHTADRLNRLRIVACCIALQGAVAWLLMMAGQGQWASRELLLGVSLVLGAVRAFHMSASQALVPSLVPAALLPKAMALGSSGIQVAVIGGPAVGGLLFTGGVQVVYGAALALLVVACAACLAIGHRHVAPPPADVTLDVLLAGVRYVWHHRVLLGAMSLDLFAVLLGGATALLPIYARDILHVGPQGLGLLRAAPAVGALMMGLALTRWPMNRHVGRRLFWAVAAFGACMIVFGLSTSFWLTLVALAASGAADTVSVVIRQTLMQLETPEDMRGRVASVNTLFIGASNQLGEFESGITAAAWGPVASVVVGGVGTIAVALTWRRLFAALARRDHLSPPGPS